MSRFALVLVTVGLLAATPRSVPPPAAPPSTPETRAPAPAAPRFGWEADATQAGDEGADFVMEGRVVTREGRAVHDALVYAHHASPRGGYTLRANGRPAFEAVMRTNVIGGWRLRTKLPGVAEGVVHVHFEVLTPADGVRQFTANLYRSHGAGSDSVFATLVQIPSLGPGANGPYVERGADGALHARWDLVEEKGVHAALSPAARRAMGR